MKTKEKNPVIENAKVVACHKEIATHLEEVGKKHREAATFHESGDYDKACSSLVKAHSHLTIAAEVQTDMLKHYAFTS